MHGLQTQCCIIQKLGILPDDIEIFTRVDESLLQELVNGHFKVAKDTLYLETGSLPNEYIWADRRLINLQIILKRDKTELTRRVYEAQKRIQNMGISSNLFKTMHNL